MTRRVLFLCFSVLFLSPFSVANAGDSKPLWVLIGTYTRGKSNGIYRMKMDANGKLSKPELAAATINPSFLAIHPSGKYLYAVNEIGSFDGKRTGAVSAFALNAKTGELTFLNQKASGGTGPCHLIVDKAGKHVLVANYGGGSAAVLPIKENGSLAEASSVIQHKGSSVNPRRQRGPHAHAIHLDAMNRFAFVADLGLDKIMIYRFNADKGTLTPNDPASVSLAPGAGPRHFAFHPNGNYAYVINEMNSTVTAMKYDARKGALTKMQTLPTLPKGWKGGNSTAEVQVHPSGKLLFGSNRGHNSIASFKVDPKTGKLTPTSHQGEKISTPRNFGIVPSGKFLLVGNQSSDSVIVFKINPENGALTSTGEKVEVGSPVCIRFMAVSND